MFGVLSCIPIKDSMVSGFGVHDFAQALLVVVGHLNGLHFVPQLAVGIVVPMIFPAERHGVMVRSVACDLLAAGQWRLCHELTDRNNHGRTREESSGSCQPAAFQ